MGERSMGDGAWNPGTLARGQCWRVRIKKGGIETIVKVLDFDGRTVVLRDIDNVDLIARYELTDVEFLQPVDP